MKLIVACAVLFAAIIQNLGSEVEFSGLEVHEKLKNEIEEQVTELTWPVLQAANDLTHKVALYKQKHLQAKSAASLGHFHIDTVACQKLSDTLVSAGELAWNATTDIYEMTVNVTDTLGDLTKCIGWNPIDTAKCYVNSITDVIKDIKSIKPTIMNVLHQVISMSSKLEPEFMDCIGNGPTTSPPTNSPPTTLLKLF